MPGKDAEELVITIPEDSSIHVAPYSGSLVLPDSAAGALDSRYDEVGFITADAVVLRAEFTSTDIETAMSLFPIKRLPDATKLTAVWSMQQWNGITLPTAFGGLPGDVIEDAPGEFYFPIPDGNLAELSVVFQWADASYDYRVVIPKGTRIDPLETGLMVRNAEVKLPMGFGALKVPGTPIGYVRSTNPTLAHAS